MKTGGVIIWFALVAVAVYGVSVDEEWTKFKVKRRVWSESFLLCVLMCIK